MHRTVRENGGGRGSRPVGGAAKRPVLGFVVRFLVLLGGFYIATAMTWYTRGVFPGHLASSARTTAAVLRVLGEDAVAVGREVRSSRFVLAVKTGCDAIEPSALFAAAVLATPLPLRRKLLPLVAGVGILVVANYFRLVSLFAVGVWRPQWFEAAHVGVWQPLFVGLVAALWLGWATSVLGRAGDARRVRGAG